jgi:hypothetical protein
MKKPRKKLNAYKDNEKRVKNMETNISYQINKNTDDFSLPQPYLKSKIGVWIDGKTYWIQNGAEKIIPERLVSIRIQKRSLHSKITLLDVFVTNHNQIEKEVKLIVTHSHEKFAKDDFTFISPTEKAIYHIGNRALYMVSGQTNGSLMAEYTVQPVWNIYTDRFWDSRKKGTLKFQPMFHGPSNSVFALKMKIQAASTQKANTWVVTGNSKSELLRLNQVVLKNTLAF